MTAFYRNNIRGDTIVEVMIAIAILSSVLGISFATMNRSLKQAVAAQERTEALKLTQGQVEGVKYFSPDPTGITGNFCIKNTSGSLSIVAKPNAPDPDLDLDDFSNYPADCKSGFYNFAVSNSAALPKIYHFYTRWDRIGGGRDQIEMFYQIQ